MTDTFKDISDEQLLAEIHDRSLENEVDCDCSDEEDTARAKAYLEFIEHDDNEVTTEIQSLCDTYQYNNEETFLRHAKQFLIDHGGLIA